MGCYGTSARPIPTGCGGTYPQTWGICLWRSETSRSFVAASFQPDRLQGLVPSERTSTGEILDDTRRLRRPRHAPDVHLRAGKPALRLPTAKPAPGAMDRRVERSSRFGSFHSVEDHRIVPIEPLPKPRWPGTMGVAPLRTTQRSRSLCGSRQAWLWWLCTIRIRVSPMIRKLVSAS
jgi:hypothetical protein